MDQWSMFFIRLKHHFSLLTGLHAALFQAYINLYITLLNLRTFLN